MFQELSLTKLKTLQQGNPLIVVPFREQLEQKRGEQLKEFVSYFTKLELPLMSVLIVEQESGKKFNRGALLNIGVRFAKRNGFKYIIAHDVDLLPKKEILPYYKVYPKQPIHIGKAWIDKYNYPDFLGGVLSISVDDMEKINGFPSNFWGWGGEDDAMKYRFKFKNIKVWQPTSRSGFIEMKHIDTRIIQDAKNMFKWEGMNLEKANKNNSGIKDLKFKVLDKAFLAPTVKKIVVSI